MGKSRFQAQVSMRCRFLIACCVISSLGLGWSALSAEPETSPALPLATNVSQFNRLSEGQQRLSCRVHFEGVVAWASRDGSQIVFQDSSGAELLEIGAQSPPLHPGERVAVDGIGSGGGVGMERGLGSLLVVNNDGVHGLQEKSGSVSLRAGKYPFRVCWFMRQSEPALEVCYEGPGLPRQAIPASAVFRQEAASAAGPAPLVNGLDYQAYEGDWWQLPDFKHWPTVKTGTASTFDLTLRSRATNAALSFGGYIEIPRDGRYTFSTLSDGGSQLYLERLRLKRLGEGAPPQPQPVAPGERLSSPVESQWASVEGVVRFVGKAQFGGWELELGSAMGNMNLVLAEAEPEVPACLRNSRVRASGLYRPAYGGGDRGGPGGMWVPDQHQLEVLEIAPEVWASVPVVSLAALTSREDRSRAASLVHVRGRVRSLGQGSLVLDDGTAWMTLRTAQPLPSRTNILIEALATCHTLGPSNNVLQSLSHQVVQETPSNSGDLPLLTTVQQIKSLERSEALRGYPVHVRGAITWSAGSAVVIQDSTAGIYVSHVPVTDADGFRAGEYWDITGITSVQFSPMVQAQRVVRLGLAAMPEPLRPTWDQLINGSLDTQFVEVRGVVTGLRSNTVTLLIHGGKINLDLPEVRPETLQPYDGTLIRVRGCLWAAKDETTHVFKIGEVQIHNASIAVDEPAPADPFLAPRKHAADLLLYDRRASAFQRVSVSGQFIHARNGEFFLMDGHDGLRFIPKTPLQFDPGDLVEVVGFPELGGPSPVLREAVARRTGHAPLPEPTRLTGDTLLASHHDSTLVQVRAELTKVTLDQKDQVLGLQIGQRNFVARISANPQSVQRLRVGSRLDLSGTYVGRGGDRADGGELGTFELLLNYPSDIRVIAQPPWWTLQRLLATLGLLGAVLGIALVWIGLLRRQVEQRTAQLKAEIHERQQAEHQRAVEAERSRLARDLHDDLGSSLTEISLLADAGPGSPPSLQKAGQRFSKIGDKARALVNALDVIVWLVNPRKDALPFLAGYLASYAEEYLSNSGISCRLKMPREIPPIGLTAEVRHSLFLAVKEALHNIVTHAHASEVLMELSIASGQLTIVIADNGRGFDYAPGLDGNGLANLRDRLAGIGGCCDIASRAEVGTQVTLSLALNHSNPHPL